MGFFDNYQRKKALRAEVRAEAQKEIDSAYKSAFKKKLVADERARAKLDARSGFEKFKDAKKKFDKFKGRKVKPAFDI